MEAPDKTERIARTLEAEIQSGAHGASGAEFLTTRDIAGRFGISMENACRVTALLRERRILRLDGKHFYVCTGCVSPESPYGRRLAMTRRPLYGLILRIVDNPFFSSLAARMCEAVSGDGVLMVSVSGGDLDKEAAFMDAFIEMGARGIFTCPSVVPGARELYARCPLPLVVMGQDLRLPGCGTVLVDNQSAGAHVASHLVEIGCTRFAYVGMSNYLRKDPRLHGFAGQLQKAGHTLAPEAIIAAGLMPDGSPRPESLAGPLSMLLRGLLPGEKLGIFCFQDLMAADVLRFIKHYRGPDGRRFAIPEDAAVAGFDDLPIAVSVTPNLTTVSYRYDSIAASAAALMKKLCETGPRRLGVTLIDSSLTVRGSTLRGGGAGI